MIMNLAGVSCEEDTTAFLADLAHIPTKAYWEVTSTRRDEKTMSDPHARLVEEIGKRHAALLNSTLRMSRYELEMWQQRKDELSAALRIAELHAPAMGSELLSGYRGLICPLCNNWDREPGWPCDTAGALLDCNVPGWRK
jgi:hypothetical protein